MIQSCRSTDDADTGLTGRLNGEQELMMDLRLKGNACGVGGWCSAKRLGELRPCRAGPQTSRWTSAGGAVRSGQQAQPAGGSGASSPRVARWPGTSGVSRLQWCKSCKDAFERLNASMLLQRKSPESVQPDVNLVHAYVAAGHHPRKRPRKRPGWSSARLWTRS